MAEKNYRCYFDADEVWLSLPLGPIAWSDRPAG